MVQDDEPNPNLTGADFKAYLWKRRPRGDGYEPLSEELANVDLDDFPRDTTFLSIDGGIRLFASVTAVMAAILNEFYRWYSVQYMRCAGFLSLIIAVSIVTRWYGERRWRFPGDVRPK